jgi:SEC-C motif-containing protein
MAPNANDTLARMASPFAGAGSDCPCGSGAAYGTCCGPLHDGATAATAEALMRARYTAYATDRVDYLFSTWHPRTRPSDLASTPAVVWLGLEVLHSVGGSADEDVGTVEFRARFRSADGEHVLHEVSRFQRRGGRWVYVDGEIA